MLHQMPAFMAALHGQPESPPVADSLVMITFDAVAQRLCVRQHKAHLCVLDSFETTKLGAHLPLSSTAYTGRPAVRARHPQPLHRLQHDAAATIRGIP